jgi:hypothetical protein
LSKSELFRAKIWSVQKKDISLPPIMPMTKVPNIIVSGYL